LCNAEGIAKGIRNPYPRPDHHQKLVDFPIGRPNHHNKTISEIGW